MGWKDIIEYEKRMVKWKNEEPSDALTYLEHEMFELDYQGESRFILTKNDCDTRSYSSEDFQISLNIDEIKILRTMLNNFLGDE